MTGPMSLPAGAAVGRAGQARQVGKHLEHDARIRRQSQHIALYTLYTLCTLRCLCTTAASCA